MRATDRNNDGLAENDRAYISQFLASAKLDSMGKCGAMSASKIRADRILLVVDLEKDGAIDTFASDGAFVFSKDMASCVRDGDALMKRFDFRDPR